MPRQSRPVIYRIFAIDGVLSGGACAAADALAERLEVSRRTIERDIEQLRDFFGAPIAYDRKRRGYWYDRPFNLPRATLRFLPSITMISLLACGACAEIRAWWPGVLNFCTARSKPGERCAWSTARPGRGRPRNVRWSPTTCGWRMGRGI